MQTHKIRFIGYIVALLIVTASVALLALGSFNEDPEICGFPIDGDISAQVDCIPLVAEE